MIGKLAELFDEDSSPAARRRGKIERAGGKAFAAAGPEGLSRMRAMRDGPPAASDGKTPGGPPIGARGAIRLLLPYLWPKDNAGLRLRVVAAAVFLVLSKGALVMVPIFYKGAVDRLTAGAGGAALVANPAVSLPLGMILAYGLARVMSLVFGELRDFVFGRVVLRAMRQAALNVFRHLHALSLRFHLERQTGGLTRSIERGTKAIETLMSLLTFNIVPTLFEIALVCVLLWRMFDVWFALVTLVTVIAYIVFSVAITNWRVRFRREMNESDSKANTRAIDSLINYETVKYFGNEDHEARRYDESLARYERASSVSRGSLLLLNVGQAFIISLGVTIIMTMAAVGIVHGTRSLGDFVLVNTYLLQLYQPLNFFGFVYRGIQEALTDMERMFQLLTVDREVADAVGAPPLALAGGAIEFRDVSFDYDPRRRILDGCIVYRARRASCGDRRPQRRRQIHHRAAAVPVL